MHMTTQAKPLKRAMAVKIVRSRFAAAAMAALAAVGTLPLRSEVASAATAPACIVRGARGAGYMQIINKCSRPERVQVRVKFGPDTACVTIPVGQHHWFEWPLGGYRKTSVC